MWTFQSLSIDTRALRMDYYLVPWDTQIFGRPVAQIENLEVTDRDATADFEVFEAWSRDQGIEFTTCRLDHRRLREVAWLESCGFRFVETMLYPTFDAWERLDSSKSDATIDIVTATPENIPDIQTVAANAFVTSRFLIDPGVARGLGESRYSAWVRNSFSDPRHDVLMAMQSGAMVGFFIVEEHDDGRAYWHLTAVSPGFQGRGIGKAMWTRMMQWHRERGVTRLDTAISGHNLPVIGLYGGLGWRFSRSDITLHRGSLTRP